MKAALPALAVLALAVSACGSPTPAPKAPAAKAEDPMVSTRALFGTDDWNLIGGKCVAVLDLPVNKGKPDNDAAHDRWAKWLENSIQSELADQMVTLNRQTYAASPDDVMIDAATYCRTKLEEVSPQTAPAA